MRVTTGLIGRRWAFRNLFEIATLSMRQFCACVFLIEPFKVQSVWSEMARCGTCLRGRYDRVSSSRVNRPCRHGLCSSMDSFDWNLHTRLFFSCFVAAGFFMQCLACPLHLKVPPHFTSIQRAIPRLHTHRRRFGYAKAPGNSLTNLSSSYSTTSMAPAPCFLA
jgi:hypothetical protein